jgi:hypothetical protein
MAVVDDVNKSVKTVEDLDHKSGDQGGGKAAYAELKKEYDTYTKTHTPEENKKYWDGVTDTLKKDNVLPDLAVAWGKENVSDVDGKKAGDLTSSYRYELPYDGKVVPLQYNFDKAMADSLKDNFKTVDTTGGWFFGKGSDGQLSEKDLDKYLENQTETNKKNAEKQTARDDQAPLFKGTPPLISVLDGANDNNNQDGTVGTNDMKRYLEDYNRFTNNGATKAPDGSPYTPENAKYVQEILDGKHPSVSDGGRFNLDDLSDKGGMATKDISSAGDYDSVVSDFNKMQPAADSKVAKTPGIKTDGDNTSVTYPDGRERDFHFTGGKLDQIKDFNGTYKKDGDNWVDANDASKKAPFKDVTVDRTTGATSYDMGAKGKLNVDQNGDLTTATATPEAGKGKVTANDSGEVTDVNYADGKKMHFDYADGKMSGFTNIAGHKFTSQDGGKTFKSDKPGDPVVSNASVDADGTFHFKANDKSLKVSPDDKVSTDAGTTTAKAPDAKAPDAVEKQLIDDSKAKAGEGYIKIAARLLGKPDSNDSDPAVYKLYKELQELNGNKHLNPGDPVLTPETLAKLKDKDLKDRLQTLEEAANNQSQTIEV